MTANLLSILSLFLISFSTMGYVHQRTPAGGKSLWPSSSVSLYVNGANSSGIPSTTIASITRGIVGEWNSAEAPNLSVVETSDGAINGRNDLYFSTSTSIFPSTSVLAVTETVFNSSNGRIIESDIVIKDSVLFSSIFGSDPYVGDVISHELGHFLGMDHATLPFSTMYYLLVRGQSTPSYDDILGLSRLYNPGTSANGTISGTVAGSSDIIPIFAAEVDLISSKDGRVIASVLTEQTGRFEFRGIPLDDVYYIFVRPPKVTSSMTSFYSTVRDDFCTGYASYKGTFFETCNNGRRGYPQGIPINIAQTSVDLGVVSIKCDLKVPSDYFSARGGGELNIGNADRSGDSIVGFFTSNDLDTNQEDVLTIDLSHINASSGNLFLDVSLLTQDFQSQLPVEMEIQSPALNVNYAESINSDLNPNLNLKGQIPLDRFNSSNNVFTVTIRPKKMTDFLLSSNFPTVDSYFPDFTNNGDDRFFYQFIYFIGESSGGNYSVFGHGNYLDFRGNTQCMEGNKTYGVKSQSNVTGVSSQSNRSASSEAAIACGTIAFVNDDPPGPGSGMATVLLGFLLSFAFFFFKRKDSISF